MNHQGKPGEEYSSESGAKPAPEKPAKAAEEEASDPEEAGRAGYALLMRKSGSRRSSPCGDFVMVRDLLDGSPGPVPARGVRAGRGWLRASRTPSLKRALPPDRPLVEVRHGPELDLAA